MPPKRRAILESSSPAAPPKRRRAARTSTKHTYVESPPSQKRKSNQHPHGDSVNREELYSLKQILAEKGGKYLIEWEGTDSTGKPWEPTWEPKANANEAAIAEWEERKAVEGSTKKKASPPKKGVARVVESKSKGRRQSRKVIESSPLPEEPTAAKQKEIGETLVSSAGAQQDSTSSQLPGDHSSQSSAALVFPDNPRTVTGVYISQLTDFDPEDYTTFSSSQIISGTAPQRASSPSSTQVVDDAAAPNLTQKHSQYESGETSKTTDTTDSTVVNSSSSVHTFPVPVNFGKGTIIPDSQDVAASLSYVPSTQQPSGDTTGDTIEGASQHTASEEHRFSQVAATEQRFGNSQNIADNDIAKGASSQDSEQNATTQSQSQGHLSDHTEQQVPESSFGFVNPEDNISEVPDLPFSFQVQHTSPRGEPSGSHLSRPQATQTTVTTSPVAKAYEHGTELANGSQQSTPFSGVRTSPRELSVARSGAETVSQPTSPAENSGTPSERFQTQISFPGAARKLDFTPSQNNTSDLIRALRHNEEPSYNRTQSTEPSLNKKGPQHESPAKQHLREARNGLNISSPPISSEPLPGPPSQFPETLGNSAPQRPSTLSDLPSSPQRNMDSPEPTPGQILAEKLRQLREDSAAKRQARRAARESSAKVQPPSAIPPHLVVSSADRDARSPSTVPAAEAIPDVTPEENMRSERYETLLNEEEPDVQMHSTHAFSTNGAIETAQQHATESSVKEYIMPITLGGAQKDQYKQTIVLSRELINEFTSELWPIGSVKYLEAQQLVNNLRNVTFHPDLLNPEAFTQIQVDAYTKAQWDQDCSAKFRFLHHLLNGLRDHPVQVAIVLQPGSLMEILETFLEGIEVAFTTWQGHSNPSLATRGSLRVTIVASTNLGAADLSGTTQLAVALDNSFVEHPDCLYLIGSHQPVEQAPLFVSLVVPGSVEHIDRYMRGYKTVAESMHVLVKTAAALRNDVGRREDGLSKLEDTATELAQFVLDGSPREDWPFGQLAEVSLAETEFGSQESGGTTESLNGGGGGTKRPLDEQHPDADTPKKQRTTGPEHHFSDMPTTINPLDIEITHVSDSMGKQTQMQGMGDSISMSQYLAALQTLGDENATRQKELHDMLRATEGRSNQYQKALEDLQYRYEDLRKVLMETRAERDGHMRTAELATSRMTANEATITTLRTERNALKEQLAEVTASMANHTIPERAELEAQRVAASKAEAGTAKLEARVQSMTSELDYIRSKYQDASNQATALASANSEYEARIAVLEKKASGESARARQINVDGFGKQLLSEYQKVKQVLSDREALLRAKEEEINRLKEAQRGRMGTRGSSVPRSPRLGSPMRLEVGAARVGSRQNSPAAKPHPLSRQG